MRTRVTAPYLYGTGPHICESGAGACFIQRLFVACSSLSMLTLLVGHHEGLPAREIRVDFLGDFWDHWLSQIHLKNSYE